MCDIITNCICPRIDENEDDDSVDDPGVHLVFESKIEEETIQSEFSFSNLTRESFTSFENLGKWAM